jgi:MIP family channel proteins
MTNKRVLATEWLRLKPLQYCKNSYGEEVRRRLVAEFLGTYILLFAGTGAVIIDSVTGAFGHIGVALVFGMVVTAIVYSFGHISGAHVNPAVTISFAVMGEFQWRDVVPYILSQLSGAIFASLSLFLLFGNISSLGATIPREGYFFQTIFLEFILSFILMLVIALSAVHSKAIKSFAGISIGFTVGLEAMFGGPISGASMNPARSIAPAIVSGDINELWIYITAPILGAVTSVFIYKILVEPEN